MTKTTEEVITQGCDFCSCTGFRGEVTATRLSDHIWHNINGSRGQCRHAELCEECYGEVGYLPENECWDGALCSVSVEQEKRAERRGGA